MSQQRKLYLHNKLKNINLLKNKRGFASDNNAGVSKDVFEAMLKANNGHTIGYGDDKYTEEAIEKFKNIFGKNIDVFFVLTGTGANVLSLTVAGSSFNSVICAETAHINVDECGAPEKFSGMKIIAVETDNGKLTIDKIEKYIYGFGFEHHSQPRIVSITQPTELGTVYTPAEVKTLANYTHKHNMILHMDGARISNAVASLNVDVNRFTKDAGVDILSFGGTKNGMMYGEAVVFFDTNISANFKYFRKQGMQLASKMRFIGAQFTAFFKDNLWLKNASHSNKMAKILAEKVAKIPCVNITQKVESNGVFAIVPAKIIPALQQEYFFYMWDETKNEVRWMCSFDTTEDDVIQFADVLSDLCNEL